MKIPALIHVLDPGTERVSVIAKTEAWPGDARAGGYVYITDASTGRYACSLDYFYRSVTRADTTGASPLSSSSATRVRDPDDRVTNGMLWRLALSVRNAAYLAERGSSLYDGDTRSCGVVGGLVFDGLSPETAERAESALCEMIRDKKTPPLVHELACMLYRLYGPRLYVQMVTGDSCAGAGDRVPVPNYELSKKDVARALVPLRKLPRASFEPTVNAGRTVLNVDDIVAPFFDAFRKLVDAWLTVLYSHASVVNGAGGELVVVANALKVKWENGCKNIKYVCTNEGQQDVEIPVHGGPLSALRNLLLANPRDVADASYYSTPSADDRDWGVEFHPARGYNVAPTVELITACRVEYAYSVDGRPSAPPNGWVPITRAMRLRAAYVVEACSSYDWLDFVLETVTNDNSLYGPNLKKLAVEDADDKWPLFGRRQEEEDDLCKVF